MFHRLCNIVKRKLIRDGRKEHREVRPLRVEGFRPHLTPKPDDAELAAQALLETLVEEHEKRGEGGAAVVQQHTGREEGEDGGGAANDAAYYRSLADRIHAAHAQEARLAKRYLAYAEERLLECGLRSRMRSADEPPTGELGEIERGLYPFQDCVEREGGELKKRWQHCLAEVIVAQMSVDGGEDIIADD